MKNRREKPLMVILVLAIALIINCIPSIFAATDSYTINWIIPDDNPPSFDNLRNFTHIVNTSFSNSITASDDISIDIYRLNDTSIFSINETTGLITNNTNLSTLELYWLNISVNDSSGNIASGIFYINVTEEGPEITRFWNWKNRISNMIVAWIDSLGNAWFNGSVNIEGNATINDTGIFRNLIINDGNLTLTGSARVRKNVEIAIGSMKPPTTNPADWTDLGIAGAWSFADNKISTVILEMPLPLDIDRSEDVIADIAWASPSTTGDCVWQLSYLLRSENEPINAGADDTLSQTVAPSGTAYGLVSTSFTIPSADISDTDKLLILKLERIGNDANDDLGDVAYLTAMNFNYISDKLGESLI